MNQLFVFLLSCIVAPCSVNAMEGSAMKFPLHEAVKSGKVDRVEAQLAKANKAAGESFLPFCMAMHDRVGENSPASLLSQYLFQDIRSYLKPIDQQDNYGSTPLHWAAYNGNEAIARLFLDRGANPNLQNNDGQTPLLWAALFRYEAIVRLLLDRGADPNLQDNDGWTPLHCAAVNGYEAIARLLLEKGADATLQTKESKTAMQLAAEMGHSVVVKIIKEPIKSQALALVMGLHPRTGENSPLNLVDTPVIQNIIGYLNK